MAESTIYKVSQPCEPLRQGEILTDLTQYIPNINGSSSKSIEVEEDLSFTIISHSYSIIVTQDCDLDWDYKARNGEEKPSKLLNSIILCELDEASKVREIPDINRKIWELVASNRHERYHFFQKVDSSLDLKEVGLPELTADFKKVFGINAKVLYALINKGEVKRRTHLSSPYLEHFSKRYHSFHERVALPFPHESEK